MGAAACHASDAIPSGQSSDRIAMGLSSIGPFGAKPHNLKRQVQAKTQVLESIMRTSVVKKTSIALFAVSVLSSAQAGGVFAVSNPLQGTWTTTLQGRDLDGNAENGFEAFYDTSLDITWLNKQEVHYPLDWHYSQDWASKQVVFGIGQWRLPRMLGAKFENSFCNYGVNTNCGYKSNPATSELAHLYFDTLGVPGWPDSGLGLTNIGPFADILPNVYWMESSDSSSFAWRFDFNNGYQDTYNKIQGGSVWLVHNGDVSPVPELANSAYLFLGLACIALVSRRRSQSNQAPSPFRASA